MQDVYVYWDCMSRTILLFYVIALHDHARRFYQEYGLNESHSLWLFSWD